MKTTKQFYDKRLHSMLTYKRNHESKTERQWIEQFLGPYEMTNVNDMALVVVTDDKSRTLFSCHTDTVHRKEGRQKVLYSKSTQSYYKNDKEPLGADDGAGAWLMLEMIDAGVPGTYVFHRGEECGGIGSSFIAKHYEDFLKGFDRAIAFDRRGSISVITHQGYYRCCSDEFAQALADAINADDASMYEPDDTGVFTDTANYTGIIPECTNLSCGYANEHSGDETLHLPTLFALRDTCLRIDWESLPTKRDPSIKEAKAYDWMDYSVSSYKNWGKSTYKGPEYSRDLYSRDLYSMTRREIIVMAYTDPETFVELVRSELYNEQPAWEYSYDDLRDAGFSYDSSIRRR